MEVSHSTGKRPDGSSPSSRGVDTNDPFHYSVAPTSNRLQVPSGPPLKSASSMETVFRLLCPSDKTGSVIGKGGAVVRQISEETGARVHIDDPVPGSSDRVVLIVADVVLRRCKEGVIDSDDDPSPAQRALIRVFERIVRGEECEGGDENDFQRTAACRLLTPSGHVGCVLGKGGKIVEKIRQVSAAYIRVLPKEHVPLCAVAGDELIQISGSFSAVKKALLSVASCLQDNVRADPTTFSIVKSYMGNLQGPAPHAPLDTYPQRSYILSPRSDDHHRAYSSNFPLDNIASGHRKLPKEEVAFRMLCTNDKVGCIIGKSGVIVRSLQSETGAVIKIIDGVSDSDDRIILISAYESYEFKHSPAQDAVFRVHSRLTEACMDKELVSARFLVPAQQIGCLLGKGGSIIAEMRRKSGANVKIFMNEQLPKCAQPDDELVQVSGSFQSAREALFHITYRIRETFFSPKHHPNIGMSHSSSVGPEILPSVRTKNDAPPPVRNPVVGFPHVLDPSLESPRNLSNSSPKLRTPQSGNPKATPVASATQAGGKPSKTVTIAVPQHYMGFVHGESDGNLALIKEVSGAMVTIYDPKPGTYEGTIVISGTQKQTSTAHGLVHAFILDGL